MRTATAFAALALLAASGSTLAQEGVPNADTGVEVDPQAYAGVWYEVARTPAPFEAPCDGGVTALYEITEESSLRIVNRCDLPDGEVQSVEGSAEPVNESFNAFEVNFPEDSVQQGANYLIEALGPLEGDQYQWAVVRGPGEGFGWILSRTPELDDAAREEAERAFQDAGLDPAQLQDTEQPPQNYDPEEE